MNKIVQSLLLIILLAFTSQTTFASQKLTVAVASNFAPTAKLLAKPFEQNNHIKIQWVSSATGALFQQVMHGAPYDAFFSADNIRPQKLVDIGKLDASSLALYTIGQLSLYPVKQSNNVTTDLHAQFQQAKRIAIANPDIAPYGKAAKRWLENNKLWTSTKSKLIRGINVSQTFQQTRSGAVDIGFVAASQLLANRLPLNIIALEDSFALHQYAGVLTSSKNKILANKLISYFRSSEIQQKLSQLGYIAITELPPEE